MSRYARSKGNFTQNTARGDLCECIKIYTTYVFMTKLSFPLTMLLLGIKNKHISFSNHNMSYDSKLQKSIRAAHTIVAYIYRVNKCIYYLFLIL